MPTRQALLVVDDDADLRQMFRTVLTLAGFDVREAPDGLDALRRIDENPPDAVILDLMMPLISGFAVLQDLMAQAHTRNIPVVVVTATAADVTAQNVACVLRKPVTPEALIRAVRTSIGSAGMAGT
jgi:CheY-like chemotaxis protein